VLAAQLDLYAVSGQRATADFRDAGQFHEKAVLGIPIEPVAAKGPALGFHDQRTAGLHPGREELDLLRIEHHCSRHKEHVDLIENIQVLLFDDRIGDLIPQQGARVPQDCVLRQISIALLVPVQIVALGAKEHAHGRRKGSIRGYLVPVFLQDACRLAHGRQAGLCKPIGTCEPKASSLLAENLVPPAPKQDRVCAAADASPDPALLVGRLDGIMHLKAVRRPTTL